MTDWTALVRKGLETATDEQLDDLLMETVRVLVGRNQQEVYRAAAMRNAVLRELSGRNAR